VAFQSNGWQFADRKAAYREFRQAAISEVRRHGAMCRTDVERYYPSILPSICEQWMVDLGCDSAAIELFAGIVRYWQKASQLVGVAIGREGSGVVGNGILGRVDAAIERLNRMHLRWGDDILLFGPKTSMLENDLRTVDRELQGIGLSRSLPKTL